jgi:hypothetical protein
MNPPCSERTKWRARKRGGNRHIGTSALERSSRTGRHPPRLMSLLLRQSTCKEYPGIGDEPLELRIAISPNGT